MNVGLRRQYSGAPCSPDFIKSMAAVRHSMASACGSEQPSRKVDTMMRFPSGGGSMYSVLHSPLSEYQFSMKTRSSLAVVGRGYGCLPSSASNGCDTLAKPAAEANRNSRRFILSSWLV